MAALGRQLFPITEEDVSRVRAHYNTNEEKIKADCEIIENWMKQQSHFPDDYDRCRIESIHLRNKFRVERTKEKLENYYTVRGENIGYFQKMDFKAKKLQDVLKAIMWIPMPKLNANLERIYVFRATGNDDLYSVEYCMMVLLAMLEVEMVYDYAIGLRVVVDMGGINMTHYKKMDVNVVAKTMYLFQECLSGRMLRIEYVNAPSFIAMFLVVIKAALPPKLFSKLRVHKDLDSLAEVVSLDLLPSDLGGKLRSSQEIHEDVKELLIEHRDFLMNRGKMISDESKRVGDVKRNEQFGVDGTFKKITLD